MLDLLRTLPRVYGADKFSTVYLGEDKVYRVVRSAGEKIFQQLSQQSLLPKLASYGVIETAVTDRVEFKGSDCTVLEHPKLPFVTHPGEWSASMLRDAAVFLLELSIRLDEHGLMLKDGHLLNVTFHRGRPLFLDFGSITNSTRELQVGWIEEYRSRAWLPLWVASKGRFEFANAMLKTEPRGLAFKLAKSKLGSYFPVQSRRINRVYRKQGWLRTLKQLQEIVGRYRFKVDPSIWTGYSERVPEEKTRKLQVIMEHLRQRRPRSLHELAGNAGTIGEQVAQELAIPVCVTDVDPSCIEAAYQRTRAKDLPLSLGVLDLLFPLPAYGAGACRPGSVERFKADTTLATALIHHLVARPRVSMHTFVQLVADYTQRSTIIEWVDPSDKFLVQWAKSGVQIPVDYTLQNFLDVCAEHFPRRIDLPDYHPTRRLFEFAR